MSRPVRRPPQVLLLAILSAGLGGALVAALAGGSVHIPFARCLQLIGERLTGGEALSDEGAILFQLRLPRVLAAALAGAGLSAAGAMLQSLFRNPLADPFVVGASGGAALGAVGGMLLAASLPSLPFPPATAGAFLGALGAVLLVMRLAAVGGRLPTVTVLLAGFAVSTFLGYLVSAGLLLVNRFELQLPRLYSWLLGGIQTVEAGTLGAATACVFSGLAWGAVLAPSLNALALGDESGARIGVDVERTKRGVLAAASLLTAAAVSISGLVGFVGLVMPHCARLLAGPDQRRLLPVAALLGAGFLTLGDLAARSLLPPGEIPLGVVTALLGGPVFLAMLRGAGREYAT